VLSEHDRLPRSVQHAEMADEPFQAVAVAGRGDDGVGA
jgi:hypothetical protein